MKANSNEKEPSCGQSELIHYFLKSKVSPVPSRLRTYSKIATYAVGELFKSSTLKGTLNLS